MAAGRVVSAADRFRAAAGADEQLELPPASAVGHTRAGAPPAPTAGAAQQDPMSGPDGPRGGVTDRPESAAADMAGRPADGHVAPSAPPDLSLPPVAAGRPTSPPSTPALGDGATLDAAWFVAGDVVAWQYRGDVQAGVVTGVSQRAGLVHLVLLRAAGRTRLTKPAAELVTVTGVDELEATARQAIL